MKDLIRHKRAEMAAENWSPNLLNQDPGMLRFARECYADGYRAALWDADHGMPLFSTIEGRKDMTLEPDWPVAPC